MHERTAAPPYQILPSTTSHKHESLTSTLEVFSRLGMRDLDLNLHHMIEERVPSAAVIQALLDGGHRVWIVSGGWCDFFHEPPLIDDTFTSVGRQVALARDLGVGRMRLFFGRLEREACSASSLGIIAGNLRHLSDLYPDLVFVFENHDGASHRPEICREILERVDRPNIRLNFDPINFECRGVDSMEALRTVLPLVEHVHLKGLDGREFCEFGVGDVDLTPVLQALVEHGYTGAFTVEYEGKFDRTVRLYQSVRRAEKALKDVLMQA